MDDKTLNIIEKVGPTIATIVAVYIAYLFGKKHRRFEEKNTHLKDIRRVVSNLLLIWKELSRLELFLKDDDPYNRFALKYPGLTKGYFKIDKALVKKLEDSYFESLQVLKHVDVELFYNLENEYTAFRRTLNEFLFPALQDKDIPQNDLLIPIISNANRELELLIRRTQAHLSKKESKAIVKIIDEHNKQLAKPQDAYALPNFILNFLNKKLPVKSPVTQDELAILINNTTMSWAITKLLGTGFLSKIISRNPFKLFGILLKISSGDLKDGSGIMKMLENAVLKINLTQEEGTYFKNNKAFYLLILGIGHKLGESVSFEHKRLLVKINNGEIDIREKFEEFKARTIAKKEGVSYQTQTPL